MKLANLQIDLPFDDHRPVNVPSGHISVEQTENDTNTDGETKDSAFSDYDIQTGHRHRLRHRFLQGGPQSLADYELLELYLFRSLKRQDTKPLARFLLDEFGSFANVCSANFMRLKNIKGIGEQLALDLKLIEALAQRFESSRLQRSHVFADWDQLVRYCRSQIGYKDCLLYTSPSPRDA